MLYGRAGDVHADSRVFDTLYANAARRQVPLHFHPLIPRRAVIDAYYSDLGATAEIGPGVSVPVRFGLATAGIGWYYETGVEFLRMILSGVFDRHPDLQVIAGHSGEVVLFYADHTASLAAISGLRRPLIDYFRQNFWITGNHGQRQCQPPLPEVDSRTRRHREDALRDRLPLHVRQPPGGYSLLNTSSGVARSHLEDAPFTRAEDRDRIE